MGFEGADLTVREEGYVLPYQMAVVDSEYNDVL